MGENNKLDNHSNFAYPHIVPTRLLEQLILTINIELIFEVVTSYFPDILLLNSDFITVCDLIHLLLLLN